MNGDGGQYRYAYMHIIIFRICVGGLFASVHRHKGTLKPIRATPFSSSPFKDNLVAECMLPSG